MTAELVRIPFHGTDLVAVDVDGKPEVVFKAAVESLGLAVETQRRKLNSRSWACATQRVVQTGGQSREVTTVDVRTFLMLLATINENNVAEDKRPLLIAYQSEVADVIEAYWRDGGAINPRATEDQLAVVIDRAERQARVLQALKGIVDPKHLELKARLLAARAMGEEPDIDALDRPLLVTDYLRSKGLNRTLVDAKAKGFGSRLRGLYIAEYNTEPGKRLQDFGNGAIRECNAYAERHRHLFDAVWARYYAGKVAESALFAIDGGA